MLLLHFTSKTEEIVTLRLNNLPKITAEKWQRHSGSQVHVHALKHFPYHLSNKIVLYSEKNVIKNYLINLNTYHSIITI